MVLPSSACTPIRLWTFYPASLDLWETACATLRQRQLQHLRLENWSMSGQHQEKSVTSGASKSKRPMAPDSKARKQKKINLMTYKYHALGHYVDTIRCFGTTDSYSTQPVSVQVYMMFCVISLTAVMGIRASSSTEHPKLDHFGLVADQYHSKYRGLSDESTVSAWSARGWIVPNLACLLI